jgi:hypothetical protein
VANNTPGAKENYGLAKGGDRRCARCLGIVYDWRAPPGGQRQFTQVGLFLFPYGQFDTDIVFFFTLQNRGVVLVVRRTMRALGP